jgi:NDP-sugar pyrophosphorylase family protein
MIFAAGLGTRLQSLTNSCPKALVEVGGKPLLYHVIENLKQAGVQEIIINVHHFADQIEACLEKNNYFGIRIPVSDEREALLDTGGGLKKAAWFFADGQPFIVHNVDIFSNIDLRALYQAHIKSDALVTLACNSRKSSRYFLVDKNSRLCGWENTKTGQQIVACPQQAPFTRLAFGGIHVISPAVFSCFPERTTFSITDWYLQLAADTFLRVYTTPELQFIDAGKPENLLELRNKYS